MKNFSPFMNEEKEEKAVPPSPAMEEKFLKTRQILLSGEINEENADRIVKQLFLLEADSKDPVYIFIDSPGGDVDAGFAIFDAIRFVDCPVYTIGWGLVASAASLILLACPKDHRLGLPNSHYLIHQPLSRMSGVATDIEIHAAEMAKTKAKLNKIIADETGTDLEKVTEDTDRDYWLDADEAVKYGLINKVISKRQNLKK